MKTRTFFVLLTMLIMSNYFLAFPQKTYACSCVTIEPVEAAYAKSEYVFVGEILDTKQEVVRNDIAGVINYRDANLFEVTQVWKGSNQTQQIIYDSGHEESCGIDFEVGNSYLVYVYTGDDGDPYTGFCSRTTERSKAGGDLKWLGKGNEVNREVNLEVEFENSSNQDYVIEIFIGGIVAVLILSLFMIKKFRRNE
ncbi:hypothetical protein AA0X71_03920 [Robertmurraya sp. 2P01SA]